MPRFSQRFSASYVTGSHMLQDRVPARGELLELQAREAGTNNVDYAFNNRVPVSLTQWATPYRTQGRRTRISDSTPRISGRSSA